MSIIAIQYLDHYYHYYCYPNKYYEYILILTFVIEPINSVNTRTFMIASQDHEIFYMKEN